MRRPVGFTLIELAITLCIIIMLVVGSLPFIHAGISAPDSVPLRSFSVPVKSGGFYVTEVPPVITIDNCEYFYLPVTGYPGYTLTHKGDCSTCRDVMSIKIKEILNVGEAEATDPR